MIKRFFDFSASLVGILLLLPLFLPLALFLKFYDGGPVFFVQERVGQDGVAFKMFKFRTMVQDTGGRGAALTVGNDSRITPTGRFLRRFKLDEFPQLWNVLRGQMSLVGPRPEVPVFVAAYTPEQRNVLHLKPGITDPASFAFFDEAEILKDKADPERFYIEQVMPEKIRINLEYARKASLLTDFVLVLATLGRAVGVRFDLFSWLQIALPKVGL
jgi:lipopolysaccharide/colanic/teichoic acid biosynthesis glycosyltransferase